jgi:hypothetical protein
MLQLETTQLKARAAEQIDGSTAKIDDVASARSR